MKKMKEKTGVDHPVAWYTKVVRFLNILMLFALFLLSLIQYTQMEIASMRPVNSRHVRTLPPISTLYRVLLPVDCPACDIGKALYWGD